MSETVDADWHVSLDEQDTVPNNILSLAESYDSGPAANLAESYDSPSPASLAESYDSPSP